MSKEVMAHIEQKLKDAGFKKTFVSKGQRVYSIGDNYFVKTKRFARYSVTLFKGKFAIAAMTAIAVPNNKTQVSKMDWVESARVGADKFDTTAMRICNNLLVKVKQKPGKDTDRGTRIDWDKP